MKNEKTFTKQDLEKAIDEAFSLGFKLGRKGDVAPPVDMPQLANEIQITNLAKNISDNGKKINKAMLERHRQASEKLMKEWSKDASKALDEVLEAAKQHSHHKNK